MAIAATAFEVLDASRAEDVGRWNTMWESWPRREVFAHPAYARLFEDEKSRAICAVWQSSEGCVLYPLMLREIGDEQFLPGDIGSAFDLVTPYGYGGPFCWGRPEPSHSTDGLGREFWSAFSLWTADRQIVSEFVRFSLFQDTLLGYPGEREERLQNVVRDLGMDEEAIWMDFDHDARTNVRKAQRSGVGIEIDTKGDRLEEFLTIYYGTMQRRSADDSYYFPRSFFEQIHEGLPGQFAYFYAVYEGQAVSAELVLLSEENAYAFLGGTDCRFYSVRPNNLLRYHIILWAKRQGKRRYVLGGGYESGDGIFRSKLALAPHGCTPFLVGSRVFREDLYHSLVNSRIAYERQRDASWYPRPGYFPAYRA